MQEFSIRVTSKIYSSKAFSKNPSSLYFFEKRHLGNANRFLKIAIELPDYYAKFICVHFKVKLLEGEGIIGSKGLRMEPFRDPYSPENLRKRRGGDFTLMDIFGFKSKSLFFMQLLSATKVMQRYCCIQRFCNYRMGQIKG